MRKIFIDSNIQAIADEYKDEVLKDLHYGPKNILVNPLKKLKRFKKYFEDGEVKESSGKDAKGKTIYVKITNDASTKYKDYLQMVIDSYQKNLLTMHPSDFTTLNNSLLVKLGNDGTLLDKVLKLGNKKADSFHNLLITSLMYDKIRTYIYPKFLKKVGVKTCVYCNANFAITDEDGVTYYTVDHWKPKSKYPFLCISFFNLVPCCFSCNRNKGDDDDEFFCLYEDNTTADLDVLHFKLPAKNETEYMLTHNADVLSVELKESNPSYKDICKTMNDKLHINAIYQEHKDVVEETIWRRYAYNDKNIEALKASFANNNLALSDDDVKRFVFGTYYGDEDIHKRPLSRLMKDIQKM